MLETARKVWSLLKGRERTHFLMLMPMCLILGAFEALGVIAVLPFLAIVLRPDVVNQSAVFQALFDLSGAETPEAFLIWLGYAVLIAVVLGTVVRWAVRFAIDRFTAIMNASLATRLLSLYLDDDYAAALQRHSALSERMMLSEVERVTLGSIYRLLSIFADAVVIACIFIMLLLVDFSVTMIMSVTIGGAYGLAFLIMRGTLLRLGQRRRDANRKRFRVAKDAISGLREVKMFGLEDISRRRMAEACEDLAATRLSVEQIGRIPRHFLEILLLGGIVGYVLWLLAQGGDALTRSLPVMGIYALAALRLLPGMQRIFRGVIGLRTNLPALDQMIEQLSSAPARKKTPAAPELGRVRLRQNFTLNDVSFTYPNGDARSLDGISLNIAAGSRVSIVGPTGAGKSTLVNILAGLLVPQSGGVCVDGRPLDADGLQRWRQSVGYVPQNVFHFDATVAENIALSGDGAPIDLSRVRSVVALAGLDPVIADLPEGLDTRIGERAARLSGGQSQRLALARALYRTPDMLIMDEATNALDPITERDVLAALAGLDRSLTIVSIAHRLHTVRNADLIHVIDEGQLVETGSYKELFGRNETFRKMHDAVFV